jgi:hypothetical protein
MLAATFYSGLLATSGLAVTVPAPPDDTHFYSVVMIVLSVIQILLGL